MSSTAVPTCRSIASQLSPPKELSEAERAEAFELLSRHFDGVSRVLFERDLAEKNAVLLLRDAASAALVGFSTMRIYETRFDGSPISVVCSGDTIVDPAAWNSPALPREWIAAVKRLRQEYPNGPYYWLLITSGFRTYRLLSTFWRRFYPRHDDSSPPPQARLLDGLARERFGDSYDPATGIVRFLRPQVLRSHLAGIPPQRLADPHVAFFAARNPGHARGDELACLCELSDDNLTRAGQRMVFGGGGGRGGAIGYVGGR
jgi:hypothetical protein